jgi:hypothetical protein
MSKMGFIKNISVDSLYKLDSDLQYDFSKIMQSMLDNFRKRNISLI